MSGVFHLFTVRYRPDGNADFSDFYISGSSCDGAYQSVAEQIQDADEVYCSKMPTGDGVIAGPIASDTTTDHHQSWARNQDTHRRMK